MNPLPFSTRKLFRCIALFLLTLPAAFPLLAASGQQASPAQPRILAEISTERRVQLPGSQHPMAQSQFDAGRVDGRTKLQGISMTFARSAAQQADLQTLIAAQQNPSSPQFHKWLTPDEFGQRFGMDSPDLNKVSNWLGQQGFAVERVSHSRDRIFFSGTASQVEATFSTQLRYYNVGGKKQYAPNSTLSVPAALAGIVLNIGNLDSFRPHPMHTPVKAVVPKADFSSGTTGNTYTSPGDVATIYGVRSAWSAGYTGAGESIAIIGQSYVDVTDIENFQTASGWSTPKDPQMVLMPGSGGDGVFSPGDESESDLDLEWSSTMAPGANVFFVYTGSDTNYSVFDAMIYAIDDRIAPIISLSYGSCEAAIGSVSGVASIEAAAQQAATQGQTLLAASGDDGASGCFRDTDLSLAAAAALSVSYPASSTWFTAVGGTEFNEGTGTYWKAQPGTDIISSALSYIPEITWNEDDTSQLGSSGGGVSTFFTKPDWQAGVPGIPADGQRDVPDISLDAAAGHDGLLLCSSDSQFAWSQGQQSSCTNGFRDASTGALTVAGGTSFATPMFAGMLALINQKENSTGQGSINPMLYTLASNASTYASAFHDITGGDNKCDVTGDASLCPNGPTGYAAAVGYDLTTGIGSPDLANLMAVWGTSSLAPTTVTITPSVTTPQNGVAVSFTVAVAPGSGTTVPGGSVTVLVDGTAVTPDLTLSNGSATFTQALSGQGNHIVVATYSGDGTFATSTATLSLTVPIATTVTIVPAASQPSLNAQDTFSIYVYDSGGSENITGSLSILVDGSTISANVPLPAGGSPTTFSASFSSAGKHTVQAVYPGTQEFAAATGTTTVNVAPIQAATTTTITASAAAVAGVSDTFTVTVAPKPGSGAPDGTVTVSVAGTQLPALTLSGGSATFSYSFKAPGPYLIQASYSGAAGYTASTGSLKETVTAAASIVATATTIMAANASPAIGVDDSFTIAVAPASGTMTPTGAVAISVDGTTVGAAFPLNNGSATFTTSFAVAGQHTVSVIYGGNSDYSGSTGSVMVTVQPGSFTLAATSLTIQKGSSGASTITVTPLSGYTGTVTLSVAAPSSVSGVCFAAIPNAVVSGAGVVSETLTVGTGQTSCPAGTSPAVTASRDSTRNMPGGPVPQTMAAALAGLIAIGFLGRRSRKLRMLPVVLLLVAAGFAASACGGGDSSNSMPSNPAPTNAAPTTATLTVTGTDAATSTMTSQTTLTLTIN